MKQLRDLTRPCRPGDDPDTDPTRILCQRPYTAENTGAMYTHDPTEAEAAGKVPLLLREPVRPPSRGIFPADLDDATVDAVAASHRPLQSDRVFDLGLLTARMAGGRYLYPWHQFALAAIANSLSDRPVYFASATTPAGLFGITEHIVRQGLAFRLWPGDPAELEPMGVSRNRDTRAQGGLLGTWLDIPRTRLLADSVFIHRSGIPDEWEYWPDRSTLGIPNYYVWVYYALSQDPALQGDPAAMAEHQARIRAWEELATSLYPREPDDTEP